MLEFSEKDKRMVWKVVYYGPALSGKTTNLLSLHDKLAFKKRGEIFQMNTKEDRTLFFDLLPLAYQTPKGGRLKIKLFTVPGQVQYDATRKTVLMRADGIVFVADSQLSQARNNFESFTNLEANAHRVGLPFDEIPLIIQYNKRDLDEIVSEVEILQKWKDTGLPLIFSSALMGRGVTETLGEILSLVVRRMEKQYNVASMMGIEESGLIKYLLEGSDGKACS